jgi:beta-glucanase (GH16 family)
MSRHDQRARAARPPLRRGWRSPKACTLLTAALLGGAPAAHAAPTSLDVLSWADEFDGSSLDATHWTYRASGPRDDGILTPDAVSVSDGVLTIKTYTEAGKHYSGMIATNKRDGDGFEQAYGYFEARIKFNNAWREPRSLQLTYPSRRRSPQLLIRARPSPMR